MGAQSKKLLLIGGNGMLARKVSAVAPPCYKITAVDLPDFDITDKGQVSHDVLALEDAPLRDNPTDRVDHSADPGVGRSDEVAMMLDRP